MRPVIAIFSLFILMLFASCLGGAGSVRPMSAKDVFTNESAYLYGKFINKKGNAAITLNLEGAGENAENFGLGFYGEEAESYYMIPVKPGTYRFSSVDFSVANGTATRMFSSSLYLSRTIELKAGKAYYAGDWNGYNLFIISGSLAVGRMSIDSVDDLFKQTTDVMKKKHSFLEGIETVNLVQNLKGTNPGYGPLLDSEKEESYKYLDIVSMKREQKNNSMLVIKFDNLVYWGGVFGDAFRNIGVTLSNKTTGVTVKPSTSDDKFLYFPNVGTGTYRITGLTDPTGGANSVNLVFSDEKIVNPGKVITNYDTSFRESAVYFQNVTKDIAVMKPGIYFLGSYSVSNVSAGLFQTMVTVRKLDASPDDITKIKTYLADRNLDWDLNALKTTGNAFFADEFSLY